MKGERSVDGRGVRGEGVKGGRSVDGRGVGMKGGRSVDGRGVRGEDGRGGRGMHVYVEEGAEVSLIRDENGHECADSGDMESAETAAEENKTSTRLTVPLIQSQQTPANTLKVYSAGTLAQYIRTQFEHFEHFVYSEFTA